MAVGGSTAIAPDFSQWDRALDALGRFAPLAISRAINRTASNAKAAMVPVIAEDMGVKQDVVRKRITITNAREDKTYAHLYATADRIPVVDFDATGLEPSRGIPGGVKAKLHGGAGHYPNAFIAKMRSGHRGVFQRKGKARLGIYELKGPSIARVFDKHGETAQARANEMFPLNLQHEMDFLLKQSTQK